MRHILIQGDWQRCVELIDRLHQSGYLVSLNNHSANEGDLLITRVETGSDLEEAARSGLPWLAWMNPSATGLSAQAYNAGAQAVFPADTSTDILFAFIERSLAQLSTFTPPITIEKALLRHYQKGDTIQLDEEAVLEVKDGIIAQTMVHADGAEVLLGLFGPGMLVVPHPDDTCYIHLNAHTNASASLQPWTSASLDKEFPQKLRARLQQMEAWAAMQARPHLDQRVLGILSLLAEQFGQECSEGEKITVRITHSQLASAVGATRATITRTLGDLRVQGRLLILDTEDGERFCLPRWEPGHHNYHG
jgi:CRP-like cAMP-binding protein